MESDKNHEKISYMELLSRLEEVDDTDINSLIKECVNGQWLVVLKSNCTNAEQRKLAFLNMLDENELLYLYSLENENVRLVGIHDLCGDILHLWQMTKNNKYLRVLKKIEEEGKE